MPFAYKVYDQHAVYFMTFTTHQWVDVFTRTAYKNLLVNSLRFCQREKGFMIYSWVIMSNHIHLIAGTNRNKLTDIIRDFKKYTSTQIIKRIEENKEESRKHWLLWLLKKDGGALLWQEGYHGEAILSQDFFQSKERYIHLNPVRAGIVFREEDYVYSSCRSRYGIDKGMLELAEFC